MIDGHYGSDPGVQQVNRDAPDKLAHWLLADRWDKPEMRTGQSSGASPRGTPRPHELAGYTVKRYGTT